MAVRYSSKNTLGFFHRLMRTIFWGMFVAYLTVRLCGEFLLGPWTYPFYLSLCTPEAGSVGTTADASLPVPASIAEMESLEHFTFTIGGDVLKWDAVTLDGKRYYPIELESGEKVLALINKNALTPLQEAGQYRLPVGQWVPWPDTEESVRPYYETLYTTLDHYIDMVSGATPLVDERSYSSWLGDVLGLTAMIAVLLLHRIIGVRRGKFAPAFFPSRDPLLAQSDLELFAASTYAIWSHTFFEGWPLMGGVHKNRKALASIKSGLADQWGIATREEGLAQVNLLTDKSDSQSLPMDAAWDLCRATQLLGMMYLTGLIDREEMDAGYRKACLAIQRLFRSWEELAEGYLAGYESWCLRHYGSQASQMAASRRRVYERLKAEPYGPYAVAWDISLALGPDISTDESRAELKRLMKFYVVRD